MTKVTAKTIAYRTGYSVSAVSRAFRPGASIASDTRATILAVAKELGYSGPTARFSDGFAHPTVALVVGDILNPFYPATIEVMSQILFERGIRMIFHTIPEGKLVDDVLEQVLDYRVDGAIVASAVMSSRLGRACKAARMPVVHYNRIQADRHSNAVCCDNYAGARDVAALFINGGRQRVSFLGGRIDTSTHLERARGLSDALRDAAQDVFATEVGGFQYEAAFGAAERLFQIRPRIDALFCCNDLMALAALDAARRMGVGVPEDVAVVGFDDIPMASWESYRLTTVRQPVRRMLHQAVGMIFDPDSAHGGIRILPGEMRLRATHG
ncbi:DNA-binding transcriptional regulator, LacI/PurR family [Roseovarius nanhaiticus]|nr:DNA-binding transcriptional regulator, LacI/PurR family [Roseovarius nanhaiticus]